MKKSESLDHDNEEMLIMILLRIERVNRLLKIIQEDMKKLND